MSAADMLRDLVADAPPGLHVAPDSSGSLALWDGSDQLLYWFDHQLTLHLIGPTPAAAPHLADLLDALDTNTDPTAAARRVRDAIKEASQ